MKILFKEETEQVTGGCVLCGDPSHSTPWLDAGKGFVLGALATIPMAAVVIGICRAYDGPRYDPTNQIKFAASLILDGIASRLPEFKPDPNFDYDRELSLSFV